MTLVSVIPINNKILYYQLNVYHVLVTVHNDNKIARGSACTAALNNTAFIYDYFNSNYYKKTYIKNITI